MAKDLEVQIEEGKAIQDLIRQDGWRLLQAKIKEEIENERRALMEINPKSFPDLAMEFIGHQKMMKGLERILEIVEEFLIHKAFEEEEMKLKKGDKVIPTKWAIQNGICKEKDKGIVVGFGRDLSSIGIKKNNLKTISSYWSGFWRLNDEK